jgi:hypothetical protein
MNSGHKISVQPGATTSVSAPSPVAALRPAIQPAAAPVQAPQPFVPAVSQPVLHPTTPIVVPPQSAPQLQPASIGDLSADAGPLTVPTPLPAAPSAHTSIATSDDALFDNLASPAVNPQSYESAAISRRIGPGNFPLKNILLSVAVLLLLLMLVDILLDADFIGWGVPHTHFF